jgi:hypothetical protein
VLCCLWKGLAACCRCGFVIGGLVYVEANSMICSSEEGPVSRAEAWWKIGIRLKPKPRYMRRRVDELE